MPLIKWRDSYSVNNEEIDQEHMKLVELINEMFCVVRDRKGVNSINNAMDDIIHYTEIHFADEEAILAKIKFPSLEEHQLKHRELIEQVTEFKQRLNTEGEGIRPDFYKFLRGWLINHILEEDMKYSEYITAQN